MTAADFTDSYLEKLKQEYKLKTSEDYIDIEACHGAHNYHPLPVVLSRGEGCRVWDVDGKEYIDCLSAYSAVNQGHCHPRIVKALTQQANTMCLTSRAFHNDVYGPFTKMITSLFKYDKVLPMNSGVEAGETACKLMRKWAYEVKGVEENKAKIVFASGNFWGRSIAACSASTDPECFKNFGPFLPGIEIVEYNNIEAFKEMVARDKDVIAGIYVEPIQGEAGVVVPSSTYLSELHAVCKQNRILLCCDEIQTGLGRTGKLLCCDHFGVRPDIVVLGKALSGGLYPVSAVLCDDEIMLTLKPGQHGSTYGGNPLAARVAMEALNVLIDEKLCERSEAMGNKFREDLRQGLSELSWVVDIRGKGLLNAVEVDDSVCKAHDTSAFDICLKLRDEGVLAKQTHGNIIRFAPPLVISDSELHRVTETINKVFKALSSEWRA